MNNDVTCPHCGKKYGRNTFTECPRCHRSPNDPLGTPSPGSREATQAAAIAFASQPVELRVEALLRRLVDDQARTARNTETIKWMVALFWILAAIGVVLTLLNQ